jgi:hypothetical protein
VDQFEHIHDFARAYGSLCWNLAKVIPRKDLPPIYTMFLPQPAPQLAGPRVPGSRGAAPTPLSAALAELEEARGDVLLQVHHQTPP